MQVATKIGAQDVIILIDSESTHNLISERLTNLLRLLVVPMKTFIVRVSNGEHLKCQGWFEEVQVDLQGTSFSLTLYSLPLIGLDVVLGFNGSSYLALWFAIGKIWPWNFCGKTRPGDCLVLIDKTSKQHH